MWLRDDRYCSCTLSIRSIRAIPIYRIDETYIFPIFNLFFLRTSTHHQCNEINKNKHLSITICQKSHTKGTGKGGWACALSSTTNHYTNNESMCIPWLSPNVALLEMSPGKEWEYGKRRCGVTRKRLQHIFTPEINDFDGASTIELSACTYTSLNASRCHTRRLRGSARRALQCEAAGRPVRNNTNLASSRWNQV